MMNSDFLEELEVAELRLLELYHKVYGGNGSPFRQFKSFLLAGQRAKNGRKIIANFAVSSLDTGKQTGANAWSATFVHSPSKTAAQQLQAPAPQQQDNKADQSGAEAAAGVDSELIGSDIMKLSITAVSEKYTVDQLREFAKMIDATIANGMNSKQIIKSIAAKLKADESKG